MNNPSRQVSVIVPVFNGERFLREAVESIFTQGDPGIEIVIVDDGSTDRTEEIVSRLDGVQYLRQQNQGPAAARNRGLALANGNIIAFLDADDLWPAGKLERQLEYLTDAPHVDIVMGQTQMLRQASSAVQKETSQGDEELHLSVNLGASIFRKSVFDRVGLFDETMPYSEDLDWFMRARESEVAIAVIDEVMLFYRQHHLSMTHQKSAQDLKVFAALKKSLDRRRRNGSAGSLPDLS